MRINHVYMTKAPCFPPDRGLPAKRCGRKLPILAPPFGSPLGSGGLEDKSLPGFVPVMLYGVILQAAPPCGKRAR